MMHGRQGLTDGVSGPKADEVKSIGRVRVYEVAREVGIANMQLVSKIQALGIEIKNHMSSLDLDDVQRLKRALEKERQENLVEERLAPTVIRRRSKARKVVIAAPSAVTKPAVPEAAPPPPTLVAEAPAMPEEPAVMQSHTEAPQDIPEIQEVVPEPAATAETKTMEPQIDAPPAASEDSAPAPTTTESGEVAEGTPPAEPAKQDTAPAPDAATAATPAKAETPAKPATPAPAPAKKVVTANARVAGQNPSAKQEVKPVVHRYAPGYKPGQAYGPKARAAAQAQAKNAAAAAASGEQAISAADAMKMMAPSKPRIVITDLDRRRPGMRREIVTRNDLFSNRRYKGRKKRKVVSNKKGKKTEITTPAQHKRVIRLHEAITVGDIARQMGIKSTEVLKHLWAMGLTNLNINNGIDADTASLLANEFSYEVEDVSFSEEKVLQQEDDKPEDLVSRSPVITVMGHVDHGKTSLLDAIRNTAVADGEAGGITQHIGASKVVTNGNELVFLDTPGHEAFTQMRARGAKCTDMVVLVVAADDSVMPQTVEAVDHSKDAGVPIIVAVNKMDRPDANPDRVRNELSERGLIPEEWGGETMYVNVSAKTKEGVDSLLETLILQADLLELASNPDKPAVGTIIESKLDKARGAMCSVLVQEGTLRVGDMVVTGIHTGKVRALIDDHGKQVQEAGPSTPVEILGLSGVPQAGDMLNAVLDEKAARVLSEHRLEESRRGDMAASAGKTYEEILGQIRSGEAREVKVLLKTDVNGTSEAIRESLQKLGTEKVSVNVISAGVGGINETDVNLAKASGAIITGFNVRAAGKTSTLAEREGVEIRTYDVIYEMLDEVKILMQGMLPKEHREKPLGTAEVRETFIIPKIGTIAGSSVQDGKITRNCQLRLVRENVKIYEGKVSSLRRFKEDVKEVLQGYECGIGIEGYKDIRVGDVIEAYEIEEVTPVL